MDSDNRKGSNGLIKGYNSTSTASNGTATENYYTIKPNAFNNENSTLLSGTKRTPNMTRPSQGVRSPAFSDKGNDSMQWVVGEEPDLSKPESAIDKNPNDQVVSSQSMDISPSKDKGQLEKFKELPRSSKYTVLLIMLVNICHMMTYSLLGPFFPQEALKKDLSVFSVGLIFGIFAVAQLLSTPLFGAYTAVLGSKFMVNSGLFVAAVCSILFGVLEYCPPGKIFLVMCCLVRAMDGLGVSAYTVGAFSLAIGSCPDHLTFVAGLLESGTTIGLALGPVIGGFLYEAGGFGLPFYVVGSLIVVGGIILATCLPGLQVHDEVEKSVEGEKQPGGAKKRDLIKSSLVWIGLGEIVLLFAGIAFLDATLSLHAEQLGSSVVVIGLMFSVQTVVAAIGSPVLGWVCIMEDAEKWLLIFGSLVSGVSFFLVGPSPLLPFLPNTQWIIFVGMIVYGISYTACVVASTKILFAGATDVGLENNQSTYGLVIGVFASAYSLGSVIGPMAGGAMVASLGFSLSTTIVGGIFCVLCLATALIFLLRKRKFMRSERMRDLPFSNTTDPKGEKGREVKETSLTAGEYNTMTSH